MPVPLHPAALVIAADHLQRERTRQLLEQLGAQVEEAGDSLQGLSLAEAMLPDIVVLDMAMPEVDGYTVCRTIRKLPHGQSVPVLALLAPNDSHAIDAAYDAGATDCLCKPVCPTLFRRRVRYLLDTRHCLHVLAAREAQLSRAQSIAAVGSWYWDIIGHKIHLSDEMRRLYWVGDEALDASVEALLRPVHPEDRPLLELALLNALRLGVPFDVEYRLLGANGVQRHVQGKCEVAMTPAHQPLRMYGTVQDITDRKLQETRALRMANYDVLTDVPNRNLLNDRVTQAIAQAHRTGQHIVMCCLDLDGFTYINNSFGYAAGDTLLRQVAARLKDALRECDTVARLGGGEFVVVMHSVAASVSVGALTQKVLGRFAAPFAVDGHELYVTASMGISVFPQDGDSCDALLRCADAALHAAKGRGRNCAEFYTRKMGADAERHLMLQSAMRTALAHGEFELCYQPKVALPDGQMFGMEALLRWRRPGHGVVPPAEFIPLAEETGAIVAIGEWVLRTACNQLRRWHDQGYTRLTMAVNLSGRQFARQDVPALIRQVLADTGVPAASLELELTESILMSEGTAVTDALLQLKDIGVTLALDDFGTGYSSLSYLKRFPIDVLKIDRSFITDLASDAENASLTRTIILMAQSLHMKTVAEGVESVAQLSFLRRCKCDAFQGYFFSKPLDAEGVTGLLRDRRCLPAVVRHQRGRQTLLIVHEEQQVVDALAAMLENDGYQILGATTPAYAFECLAVHPVQVILCALRLPQMGGTELLERVKKMSPETIRVLLAEHRDLDAVLDAINRGTAYRFCSKPWDEHRLRDNLRDAFRHQSALYARGAPGPDVPADADEADFFTGGLAAAYVAPVQEDRG
ncbi:EAL domain-containing protein [Pseudoduganella rivuli]|nr:EAL domain-containing protein [Pseudoduganella rivuli]